MSADAVDRLPGLLGIRRSQDEGDLGDPVAGSDEEEPLARERVEQAVDRDAGNLLDLLGDVVDRDRALDAIEEPLRPAERERHDGVGRYSGEKLGSYRVPPPSGACVPSARPMPSSSADTAADSQSMPKSTSCDAFWKASPSCRVAAATSTQRRASVWSGSAPKPSASASDPASVPLRSAVSYAVMADVLSEMAVHPETERSTEGRSLFAINALSFCSSCGLTSATTCRSAVNTKTSSSPIAGATSASPVVPSGSSSEMKPAKDSRAPGMRSRSRPAASHCGDSRPS